MGQNVHVLTYAKNDEYVVDDEGVTVHRLLPKLKGELDESNKSLLGPYMKQHHWILGFSLRVYEYFIALHKKEKFDLIEAPDTCAQALFIYKFIDGPKKIVRLHTPYFWVRRLNNIPDSPENSLREALEKEHALAATAVTSPTKALAGIVKKEWGIRAVPVIPNFFSLDNYKPDISVYERHLKSRKYIIYYGRLEYRKGVHILAQALCNVLQKHTALKAVFVGDDSMYNNVSMKTGIQESLKDFSSRVIFVPNISHDSLYPLIERAEFVVLPSLWENFPYVCLEAMALWKAVIATKGSGFSEIIDDGVNGFLCPPGDPAALSERIMDCLDRTDLGVIGSNAGMKVKAFDNATVVPRILDFYRSPVSPVKRKLTVLYPTSMFPTLSETFILEQITGLIDLGHDVKIVAFYRPAEQKFHSQIGEYGLLAKTLYIPKLDKHPGFEFTPEVLDFLKDVDVIHSHFAALPTDFAMHASRLLGIPFIFTAHAYDIFVLAKPEILSEYASSAARIITISEFNREYILDMIGDKYRDKIEIIRCGIDMDRFSPGKKAEDNTINILTTGRFVEKKGIPYAVRAFAKLPDHCKAVLRIIGDGPLNAQIENIISELNIGDRVRLLGSLPQSEVINEMQRADIFILPSVTACNNDREGLPVAILEAQAMKLPVVSTFHTGIPEGVLDGRTGYLAPEKAVDILAEKLMVLAKDKKLRLRMGEEGRRHVAQNFNIRNEIIKLEKILTDPSRNKIKILFVSHSSHYFGAEQSLLHLLRNINRDRFEPIVVLPENRPEGALQRGLQESGIKTHIIGTPGRWLDFVSDEQILFRGMIQEIEAVRSYIDLIDKEGVDIVYTNTMTKLAGALSAGIPGVPHIFHVREALEGHLNSSFSVESTLKIISSLSEHIITNSNFITKQFTEANISNKITVVYNAIDVDKFEFSYNKEIIRSQIGITRDTPLIGIIGTVYAHKNHETLIKAFNIIKQKNISAHLVIIGHAFKDYKKRLETFIRKFGLESVVHFIPFMHDIHQVYEELDVVIISSITEGFGKTAVEAMAAGKPVVATDTGALPEIILDGVTGFLVPLSSEKRMADSIIRLISDPDMARRMGLAGRNRARDLFNTGKYVSGVERVFESVYATSRNTSDEHKEDTPKLVKKLSDVLLPHERKKFFEGLTFYYNGESLNAVDFQEQVSVPNTPVETRLLAFYLPQYHPIPENEEWWGRGFTEWRNVAKAKPLFSGHYQPHVPADLGFYDLRLEETRMAQAELAREYGIHGFCYYHYWFNGKRLLETPLEDMLKSGTPDFPFCICWANENWTRRWDGEDQHVLIKQEYSAEDDRRHIRELFRIFRDRRYIKIDGKPLFLVYRTENMPEPRKTADIWREEARKSGIGELYLVRVESIGTCDPKDINFDAALEFAPDWKQKGPCILPPPAQSGQLDKDPRKIEDVFKNNYVHSYENLAQAMMKKPQPGYKWFRCVTPSWDNSPRRKEGANIFLGSTPEKYQNWLGNMINYTDRNLRGEEKLVFINAWNEWAEGNHLEPDQHFGRAYLEASRKALTSSTDASTGTQLIENENQPAEASVELERHLVEINSLSDEFERHLTKVKALSVEREKLLAEHENRIVERDKSALDVRMSKLADREKKLAEFRGHMSDLAGQLSERENRIRDLLSSASWRITGSLRRVHEKLSKR